MKSYFVFDVESIGLHGEGFAVAGGVYLENGAAQWEFCFASPTDQAEGEDSDRHWVKDNVPMMEETHRSLRKMRDAFWGEWVRAKKDGAIMAAECPWPVEAGFLSQCIADDVDARKWDGPYPFMEIASFLAAAGMDPMATYPRTPSEQPAHHPLKDARQSARLLSEALARIRIAEENEKDQPLVCRVEGDQLVARIGIDVLAFASRPENGGKLEDCDVESGREREFAKDVANEMMRDFGEGPFPFPDFLDDMIVAASDHGSAALKWKKN